MSFKNIVAPNPDAEVDENWVLHPAPDAARTMFINSIGLSLMFERNQVVVEVLLTAAPPLTTAALSFCDGCNLYFNYRYPIMSPLWN